MVKEEEPQHSNKALTENSTVYKMKRKNFKKRLELKTIEEKAMRQ